MQANQEFQRTLLILNETLMILGIKKNIMLFAYLPGQLKSRESHR
jgi:hypothetical protein